MGTSEVPNRMVIFEQIWLSAAQRIEYHTRCGQTSATTKPYSKNSYIVFWTPINDSFTFGQMKIISGAGVVSSSWGKNLINRILRLFGVQPKLDDEIQHIQRSLDRVHRRLAKVSTDIGAIESAKQNVDKGTQMLLSLKYKELAKQGTLLSFPEVQFRNFSQSGEDGILHYIFSLLGTTGRRSVEICAGTGSQCNSANLIINHGWHSLLVDGSEQNVKAGVDFFARHSDANVMGPVYIKSWVSRDSVNQIMRDEGFSGEVDLLSLDLDGVDYWIWDAITEISPRVVIVEAMPHLGGSCVTVPYAEDFEADWIALYPETTDDAGLESTPRDKSFFSQYTLYGGASLAAYNKLAKTKGYRLIGANHIGYNVVFMRDDVGLDNFPEVTEASCVNPHYRERFAVAADKLKDYAWQEV